MSRISDKWSRIDKKTRRKCTLGVYCFVIILTIATLFFAYNSPDMAFNEETTNNTSVDKSNNSAIVDKTREVDLASIVAGQANLSVKNNVSERAISVYAKSQASQNDETVITKPTLSISSGNSALTTYMVEEGENANSVASKFGLTAQTVKWANGLVNDDVAVGVNLTIPVVDGVVYVVKEGDSVESIAQKYKGTSSSILSQNNIDDVLVGETILIPGGELPVNERPGYTTPSTTSTASTWSGYRGTSYSLSIGTTRAGNNYSYGYCTWYAYNRRVELGLPAYRSLGNANTWDDRSRASGITVSRIPIAGAIFQTDSGYYGHVGIVESVNADGTINISDMNGIAGWGRIGYSNNVSPSGYWFIY